MSADSQRDDPETYAIIGAAMKVHRTLGHGFLEAVYQEALELEFQKQNIPYSREQNIPIYYETKGLNTHYRSDFLCFGSMVVELKALSSELTNSDKSQILHYLKATKLSKGLLLNFGRQRLEYQRSIFTHN